MEPNRKLARDLAQPTFLFEANTPIRNVVEWFKQHGKAEYCAILQDGHIGGLVGRDQLNARMAGQYGFSVLADKPVSRVMIATPLAVEGHIDLQQLTRILLDSGRSGPDFYIDILVHEKGKLLGTASVRSLLIEQLRQIIAQNDQLNSQSRLLAEKNLELLEASRNLSLESNEFRTFFESCSIPIAVFAPDLSLLQANTRFLDLAEITDPDTARGLSLSRLFVGTSAWNDWLDDKPAKSKKLNAQETFHLLLRRTSGKDLPVEVSANRQTTTRNAILSVVRVMEESEFALHRQLTEKLGAKNPMARQLATSFSERSFTPERVDHLVELASQLDRASSSRTSQVHELQGTLDAFGPVDLLQLLSHSNKTGELRIYGDGNNDGRIYLSDGRITHAVADKREGMDALKHTLGASGGAFHFTEGTRTPRTSIQGATTNILLEACAAYDETNAPSLS